MKEYNELYSFEVFGAIDEGKSVKMLDREECVVYDCSEMKAGALVKVVNSKDKGRFKFWHTVESEAENE